MARIDTNRVKIASRRNASPSSGLDEKIYTALGLLVGVIALAGIGYTIFTEPSGDRTRGRAGWDLTPPVAPAQRGLGAE